MVTHAKGTSENRTKQYLELFDKKKVLSFLLGESVGDVVDVGANIGQSCVEFKELWPSARIHCFEPQKECWGAFVNNTSKYKDVRLNKFGLGADSGERSFYTHSMTSGQSGFYKINSDSKDSILFNSEFSEVEKREFLNKCNFERAVEIQRLDDYVEINKINTIDFMKIDTQGYELEVLKGSEKILKKIKLIQLEIMFYDFYEHNLSFRAVEEILHPHGFRLYDISYISKNPMNGRTDWVDVLYVNSNTVNLKR